MQILFALLAVIAVIAYILVRGRGASGPARDILDVGEGSRAGGARRDGFQKANGRHPVENVDDARVAAAGLMTALARLDGELTKPQIDAIRVECRAAFRVPQTEADDIAAYGRWLAGQSQDPDDAIRRLSQKLRELASDEAQRDMIGMLERVAATEDGVSEDQRAAIDRVRRTLNFA